MSITFTKMNGCGNDFIIIDNRTGVVPEEELPNFGRRVCDRHFSLGADGLLLVENSQDYPFRVRLINPDGSEGEMCGNGVRCIARYAFLNELAGAVMSFETLAGRINARVNRDTVEVELPPVRLAEIVRHKSATVQGKPVPYSALTLGVPHCVIFITGDLPEEELYAAGKEVRFNSACFPAGTNVNFVRVEGSNSLFVQTYERGVEAMTMSCGTGSASSAICAALEKGVTAPTIIRTRGGILKVNFDRDESGFHHITLTGPATLVACGELFAC